MGVGAKHCKGKRLGRPGAEVPCIPSLEALWFPHRAVPCETLGSVSPGRGQWRHEEPCGALPSPSQTAALFNGWPYYPYQPRLHPCLRHLFASPTFS